MPCGTISFRVNSTEVFNTGRYLDQVAYRLEKLPREYRPGELSGGQRS